MRKRIMYSVFPVLFLCLLFSSCGKDTNAPVSEPDTSSISSAQPQNTIQEEPAAETASSEKPAVTAETTNPSNQPKSEADMIADLTLGDFALGLGNEPCVIRQLDIIKRQTLTEQYTDTVYVTIQADSTSVSYIRSYVLQYNLYNDGWILDSASEYADGPYDTFPLTGPDEYIATRHCEGYGNRYVGGYDNITVEDYEVDLQGKTAVFYVSCGSLYNNAYITDYHAVLCVFDDAWREDTDNCYLIDTEYDWYYLCGSEWGYDGGLGIGYEYIYIYDIDPFHNTITLYASKGGESWEDTYSFSRIDYSKSGKRPGSYYLSFYMNGSQVQIDAYTLYWGSFRMNRIED